MCNCFHVPHFITSYTNECWYWSVTGFKLPICFTDYPCSLPSQRVIVKGKKWQKFWSSSMELATSNLATLSILCCNQVLLFLWAACLQCYSYRLLPSCDFLRYCRKTREQTERRCTVDGIWARSSVAVWKPCRYTCVCVGVGTTGLAWRGLHFWK